MNDKGNAAWADDWQIGLRMWVERRGQALMGKGRAELLHEIDRTHSIAQRPGTCECRTVGPGCWYRKSIARPESGLWPRPLAGITAVARS